MEGLHSGSGTRISFIIKCLNEEGNVARAIESCLQAGSSSKDEIVIADSISSDRTVEIASAYPVKIVQLCHENDRGCGAGAQLGYQHADGDYIYLMDGDMSLHAAFLHQALEVLERSPHLAGVGGRVLDINVVNLDFKTRALRKKPDLQPGEVDRLDGGGLFRRSALESVGYLADRNLHGFEEYELGARLRAKGWRLTRINQPAVDHYGYTIGSYALLWRRLKGSYAAGAGELLRAAWGKPYLFEAICNIRSILISFFVYAWLACLLGGLAWVRSGPGLAAVALLLIAPVTIMALKRRSLQLGAYAVTTWIVYAIGTAKGLLSPRVAPSDAIPSRVLQSAEANRQTAARA